MGQRYTKTIALVVMVATLTAVVFSALWGVPYIFTFIGFAAWVLVGHVVTIDDDLPGGGSNPDGTQPLPWADVLAAAILAALVGFACVPAVRALGR
jgi:hypothetical protein